MAMFNAFVIVLICLFCAVLALPGLPGDQIARELEEILSESSSIYLPSDPRYDEEITQRWDVYDPPTYVVSVKPANTGDVQKVIKYAAEKNVSFLATGGGHGYSSTLSGLQNGLVLDMGSFNDVELNSTANAVTVGGSVRASKLASILQPAGKEFPVGQCPCVGLTGFSLGGGIGPFSSLYGPASDSISSIEMVTGIGEMLTASKTENPDLFWGMKGAGFNYGAVTSLTYDVYEATNGGQAMNADMIFSGSQNGSVWEAARAFVGKQPKELSIAFAIGYNGTLKEITIIVNFVYLGPREKGEGLIKPFLDLQPIDRNITTVSWEDVPSSALYGASVPGCLVSGVQYVPHSLNLYQIDVDNMINVINFMDTSMAATPAVQTAVVALSQFSTYGFKDRHTDDSSAFPHRDVVLFVSIDGFTMSASNVPAMIKWSRELRTRFQKGSGKDNLEAYVNHAHGDEGSAAWYTERKLAKLRELKTKYDPQSLFSHFNPVS